LGPDTLEILPKFDFVKCGREINFLEYYEKAPVPFVHFD
jgi:hypothetical protein